MLWDASLSTEEIYINFGALIIYVVFLIAFVIDYCRALKDTLNRRDTRRSKKIQSLRIAIIICIILETFPCFDNLFDSSWNLLFHIAAIMSIIFDICLPVVLTMVIMRIFNNYYTLRYLPLPLRYLICCILYTISWWVSIPIEIFAIINDKNKYYKLIYRYYLFIWIFIEIIVFCCLLAIMLKLKLMSNRPHQYQSMFVINKDEIQKSKKTVSIKLCRWMLIVFGLGIYFLLIIVYYISNSSILSASKAMMTIFYVTAHISLDLTLFYYTHCGYYYDATYTIDRRSNSRSWMIESMISAKADTSYNDVDEDDDEEEFSLSETSTILSSQQINSNRYNEVIYMQE